MQDHEKRIARMVARDAAVERAMPAMPDDFWPDIITIRARYEKDGKEYGIETAVSARQLQAAPELIVPELLTDLRMSCWQAAHWDWTSKYLTKK